MASDYAFAVIEKSGCIGKIDGLFVKSGEKRATKDGLEYIFSGNNLHCTQTSFKEQMANYCRSKGGEPVQGETWCRKDDTPLFYVGELSTLEKMLIKARNTGLALHSKEGSSVSEYRKKRL